MTAPPPPAGPRFARQAWMARGRGNEPARRTAVARSARSGALADGVPRRRGGPGLPGAGAGPELLLRMDRSAPGAAAAPGRGTQPAPGIPRQACQGRESRGLQGAVEGYRALLRRVIAPAAGQDRGAQPAGGYFADRAGGGLAGEAVPARAGA